MSESRVQTVCLVILTTLAVAFALKWMAPALIPFTLAVFIAYGLQPLVQLQERYLRFPRWAALISTLLAALMLLVALGAIVSASVSQLANNTGLYSQQLERLTERVIVALPNQIGDRDIAEEIRDLTRVPLQTIGNLLVRITNAIFDLLSRSLLVLLFVSFLLVGGGGGAAAQGAYTGVWGQAEAQIRRFIVTKGAISAATGGMVGLVLSILGIDLALVFGLLAFLLNFIPSVGSVVATLLPLPVVLMNPEISPGVAFLAIALPAAIQVVVGQILDPRILGTELDLHPVTIILSLILWGMLWGIVGMLLATPLMAVAKILLARAEGTRVLADLLAGRLDSLRRA